MISANVLIGNPNKVDLEFYECCGCTRSHRINIFFTDHYDHPIYEGGVQLVDMAYLKKIFRFKDNEITM